MRVPYTPGHALPQGRGKAGTPGGQGGHCRQMIGIRGVLHAQHKAQQQNRSRAHDTCALTVLAPACKYPGKYNFLVRKINRFHLGGLVCRVML